MTKMSDTRKIKKGKIETPTKIEKRNLNETELKEYLGLVTVCNAQHWRAHQIAGNTALIHNGIEVRKTEESIAKLLENSKNNWLSRVLVNCGVGLGQSVNINSKTGEIKEAEEKLEKK